MHERRNCPPHPAILGEVRVHHIAAYIERKVALQEGADPRSCSNTGKSGGVCSFKLISPLHTAAVRDSQSVKLREDSGNTGKRGGAGQPECQAEGGQQQHGEEGWCGTARVSS